MNAQATTAVTQTAAATTGGVALPAALAALFGLAIIVIIGHVQADSLHAAAHDARHATGFPCH